MRIEMIDRVLESPQEFYRRSLFGPYMILMFAVPFLFVPFDWSVSDSLFTFAVFMIMGAMLSMTPILAVSVPLYYWMRNRSIAVLRRTLLIWPLLVAAAVILFLDLYLRVPMAYDGIFSGHTGLTIAILASGYTWVLAVLTIGRWLEKRGKFRYARSGQKMLAEPIQVPKPAKKISMFKRPFESPAEFYRRSLFGPYMILVIAIPLPFLNLINGPIPYLTEVCLAVLMVAAVGTVPHLAVSIPLSYWMRQQSVESMRKALLVWPLLLLVSCFAIIGLVKGWDWATPHRLQYFTREVVPVVIPYGYAWVVTILFLGRWLEKRGKFLNAQMEQETGIQPEDAN